MTSAESRAISHVVAAVLGDGVYRATKYLAPNAVISAARVRYGKKIVRRERCRVVSLRIGAPNHAEREFIKRALREHKHPFPITELKAQAARRE